MECIPSKQPMIYEFNLTNVPKITEQWQVVSQVEGKLKIFLKGNLFFDEEGILLVELATKLSQWLASLNRGEVSNFYYASMDYEEAPILQFSCVNSRWNISSIWEQYQEETDFSIDVIVTSSISFIEDIQRTLNEQFAMDIAKLI
jgi:hypothetical protein